MRAPTVSTGRSRWLPSGSSRATRSPSPTRTKAATVGPEPLSHTASGSAARSASNAGRDAGDIALGHRAAGLAGERQTGVGEIEPHAAAVRGQQAQVGSGAAAAVQQAQTRPAGGQSGEHRGHELAETVKPEVIGLGLMRQVEETVHAGDYASSSVCAYLRAARATVGGAFGSTRPLPYT